MDFLSAPSDFLVQCFQKFDSKDLGVEDLGKEFSRMLGWHYGGTSYQDPTH